MNLQEIGLGHLPKKSYYSLMLYSKYKVVLQRVKQQSPFLLLMFLFLHLYRLQPILLSLRRGQASVSYAQSLLGAPETRLTTLDNGFRVASEETGHATCTVRTHYKLCYKFNLFKQMKDILNCFFSLIIVGSLPYKVP